MSLTIVLTHVSVVVVPYLLRRQCAMASVRGGIMAIWPATYIFSNIHVHLKMYNFRK